MKKIKDYEQNGWLEGHGGEPCPHCLNKNRRITKLLAVVEETAKLFQKGGYFEHCVGSRIQADLQQALKEAGYL